MVVKGEAKVVLEHPSSIAVSATQNKASLSTQTGNFMGMVSPTNKKVAWTGTAIFRFNQAGKIVERWQDLDQLALFIQLGVIPPIGQQPGG